LTVMKLMLEICWELGAATFSGTSITRLKPVPPEHVAEIIEHDKLNQCEHP